MENSIIYFGYSIAFLMAFLSMLIELKNHHGSYFQFIAKSLYSYLYCGAFGIVGLVGFWLYQKGIRSVEPSNNNIEDPILKIVVTAVIIGWSAKGLLDAPILPASGNDDNREGFRFRLLIDLIFLNSEFQFKNIVAKKGRSYFKKCIETFKKRDVVNGDPKRNFEKSVYEYLDFHQNYGGGGAAEVAQFNTFMTQFAKQTDIDSSFSFAYRNLGYNIFNAIMKQESIR